jgi:hypothetical protein
MMMLEKSLFGVSNMDGYQKLVDLLTEIDFHNCIIDLFTKNQDSFGQMKNGYILVFLEGFGCLQMGIV